MPFEHRIALVHRSEVSMIEAETDSASASDRDAFPEDAADSAF
jgi:hypothetical protein